MSWARSRPVRRPPRPARRSSGRPGRRRCARLRRGRRGCPSSSLLLGHGRGRALWSVRRAPRPDPPAPHRAARRRACCCPATPAGRSRSPRRCSTEPKMFNHHRGLWGYTGAAADGELLTIQATGMGGPSAAIVLEELIDLGVTPRGPRRDVRRAGRRARRWATLVVATRGGVGRRLERGRWAPASGSRPTPALTAALARGDAAGPIVSHRPLLRPATRVARGAGARRARSRWRWRRRRCSRSASGAGSPSRACCAVTDVHRRRRARAHRTTTGWPRRGARVGTRVGHAAAPEGAAARAGRPGPAPRWRSWPPTIATVQPRQAAVVDEQARARPAPRRGPRTRRGRWPTCCGGVAHLGLRRAVLRRGATHVGANGRSSAAASARRPRSLHRIALAARRHRGDPRPGTPQARTSSAPRPRRRRRPTRPAARPASIVRRPARVAGRARARGPPRRARPRGSCASRPRRRAPCAWARSSAAASAGAPGRRGRAPRRARRRTAGRRRPSSARSPAGRDRRAPPAACASGSARRRRTPPSRAARRGAARSPPGSARPS